MRCKYCGAHNSSDARFCCSCRKLIALQGQDFGRQTRDSGAATGASEWPVRSQRLPAYPPANQTQPAGGAQRGSVPPNQLPIARAPRLPADGTAVPPVENDWSAEHPVRYEIDPVTGLPYDPHYRSEMSVVRARPAVPATFFPRLGALVVDYCILSMLWFCALVFATLINSALLGLLVTLFGPALYFIGFWSTGGRTPGYRAAGLQLIHTDGSSVGLGAGIIRYVGSMLSWPFFFLGYLWMLWDPKGQTWHDKMADTSVVQM